jgi:hypothetical protein
MKRMVDDFRDYAKTPPAVLEPLDLNALIDEILHLYLAARMATSFTAAGPGPAAGDGRRRSCAGDPQPAAAQDAMAECPEGAPPALT